MVVINKYMILVIGAYSNTAYMCVFFYTDLGFTIFKPIIYEKGWHVTIVYFQQLNTCT